MDHEQLWKIGEQVRHRAGLTSDEKRFISEVVPQELAQFPRVAFPRNVQHPAGFRVSGAPVRTLTQCILVLSAQRVLGSEYDARSEFYRRVAAELAFGIMRSHFHHDYPKGVHCCAQCTLAVYPVLKSGALRWFNGQSLAKDVRKIIETKQWRFSDATNPRMVEWSLA